MGSADRWRGPDGEVYAYDWYAMDLELHIPEQVVADEIHERGWLEEYGKRLDWFGPDAATEVAERVTRDYLDAVAERYEYEHCTPYEADGYWDVRAVVYGIKDLELQALLEQPYVDSVWLGDGDSSPKTFTAPASLDDPR